MAQFDNRLSNADKLQHTRHIAPSHINFRENGAGEAIRTPDPNLGKVVLYP